MLYLLHQTVDRAAERAAEFPLQVKGREEFGVLEPGLAGYQGISADGPDSSTSPTRTSAGATMYRFSPSR